MAQHPFAIVCDSTCDLPPEIISRLEVVCMPLGIEVGGRVLRDDEDRDEARAALERRRMAVATRPTAEEFRAVYERLYDEGYDRIVTVCSSLPSTGSWAAAEEAYAGLAADGCGLVMRTVDAGVTSVGLGMTVERLACARTQGVAFEDAVDRARELAREVRLLFIPEASAPIVQESVRRRRSGIMARASSLRLRVVGERTLFLLNHGEWTALARSTDLADLCARAAHAMSSVAAHDGDLVYAVMGFGGSKTLRALEKPLDTNEFCSMRLGRGRTSPAIMASLGADAAGVAFAPRSLYIKAGATGPLPQGLIKNPDEG